jgi:uncharacterized coiled-coil protein SlyX
MYEGEVFTYRSDRAPRPSARPVRPAPAPSDYGGRAEGHAEAERTARLEAGLLRLEDTITQLAGRLEQLTGRLEELQAARVKAVAPPPEPPPAPVEATPIKTTVTMLAPEPPPPEPAPEVKVSLYAGGATEAILGQVRVTSSD